MATATKRRDMNEPKPSQSRPEPFQGRLEEDRLAAALVLRGLATAEEIQQCRTASDSESGSERLLRSLVKAGYLTQGQARRAYQDMRNLVQQQIPGYELLDTLGRGSMGTVFKARQISMNRLVAIKTLHPRLAAKPGYLGRLTREAHLAAKLSHNNIVQAIDVGTAGNLSYFVMEYIQGTTIKQELEGGKIFSEAEALQITLQIARALQHAHGRGLIHRDVKPANIILTQDRVAKLADLGMALQAENDEIKNAERGMTIGTPFYMATEQIYGQAEIDGRADIYSLGATLYHMVTGQPPFPGVDINLVLEAHLKQELTPPDHLNLSLSSGLGELVEFMMAKDRDQRYPSAGDLIIDLECLVAGQPPKLARERMATATLAALAHGEAAEEDTDESSAANRSSIVWIAALGGLLLLSLILNLYLLLRPT